MTQMTNVTKATGEQHPFSEEKLRHSLKRSGAADKLVEKVVLEVKDFLYDGISTKKIYQLAFRLLRKYEKLSAARYSLKDAIMQMGPTGYPFEHFVGEILKRMGYQVKVSQQMKGKCVQHEVDVIAVNEKKKIMVECKYHNTRGKVSNVHVPLYIQSRFQDLLAVWQEEQGRDDMTYEGWVVTNTRFTSDAADYGRCVGLRLIGWDYPQSRGLKEMVEKAGLFPITALTELSRKYKSELLEKNIVLCFELAQYESLLHKMLKNKNKVKAVMNEAHELSTISNSIKMLDRDY